jgi:glycosyltransferase involved in cell wall biosynthesis
MNIPEDAILFLNANRNSQRKRLDLTVQGFVRLLKTVPNSYLVIASNLTPQSGAYYDIQRVFLEELKVLGLNPRDYATRMMLIDTSPPQVLDDEAINQLYNISDIGINTSDGEGFGLCQLEHMYTGAPQLVTDVGTYRTFLPMDVATYVAPNGRAYFPGNMPHGCWYSTFSAEEVASSMMTSVQTLKQKKEAVQSYQFKSWATVCDSWLEDILTLAGGQEATVSVPVM